MEEEHVGTQMTEEARDALVAQLGSASRRERQEAAAQLLGMARADAGLACGAVDALVGALDVAEAQTRWQCLDALSEVARVDPELVGVAFEGAETALFDEHSALVRLAAFRFLTVYGATTADRSLGAWPLINEAIQCYHGDLEYRDMLVSLLAFAQGDIDDEVRASLAGRMAFDAKNGRGLIRRYSADIRAAVGKD